MISHCDPEVVYVPSFIAKLWDMVNDTSLDNVISWTDNENSFIVKNKEKFTVQVLPNYFKHCNFSSFIRQLNKYGFKKVQPVEHPNHLEFAHSYFLKSNPELLVNIKRKQAETKLPGKLDCGDAYLKELFQKVQQLKKAQDNFEADLDLMKIESNALQSETIKLKRKQRLQQQVLNKIMAFLFNVMAENDNDYDNVSLPFPKNPLNGYNNLVAITEKPHITEDQDFLLLEDDQNNEDITKSESVTSEDSSENELLDSLSTSGIKSLFSETNDLGINENYSFLPGDTSFSNVGDEASASSSFGLSGLQIFNELSPQNYKSNDYNSLSLKSPIVINVQDSQNMSNEADTLLENGDLFNSNNIIIFDPSEENENIQASESTEVAIKEETQDFSDKSYGMASTCTALSHLPSQSMNDDLGSHITMMDSNLNLLKDLLCDVDLSLDENEVEKLFSTEEFASILSPDDDTTIDSGDPSVVTTLPVDVVFHTPESSPPPVNRLEEVPMNPTLS